MPIHLIRHMEAKFPEGMVENEQEWDAFRPPTEKGREQVNALLNGIREVSFSVVVHSGVLRTEYLALRLPRVTDAKIIPVPELYDPASDTTEYATLWAAYNKHGVELQKWSGDQLAWAALTTHAKRASKAVSEATELHQTTGQIAVVGHGVYLVAMAMEMMVSKEAKNRLLEVDMAPCGQIVIDTSRTGKEIVSYFPIRGSQQEGWSQAFKVNHHM